MTWPSCLTGEENEPFGTPSKTIGSLTVSTGLAAMAATAGFFGSHAAASGARKTLPSRR